MGAKRWIGRISIICVASIAAALSVASERPTSVNIDLIDNPVVVDMKLSPDGQHIGLLAPVDGRNILTIIQTSTRTPINLLEFESDRQIGDFYWANNERLLMRLDYFQSWYAAPTSAGEWFAVNIDGKKKENVFGFRSFRGSSSKIKSHEAGGERASGQVVDLLRDDKKHILMSATPFDAGGDRRSKLYKINIYNGRSKLLETSPVENATFATDQSGQVRFVVGETKELKRKVYYRANEDQEWQLFRESNADEGGLQPLAFAADNSIYVSDSTYTDLAGIYLYDLNDGTSTLIHQDEHSDPTNFWYTEASRRLYAVEYETTTPKYVFLTEGEETSTLKNLLSAFPGQQVRLISQSRDESLSIVLAYSDRNPGDYYLFDANLKQLQFLAAAMPKVAPAERSEMMAFEFTARDGLVLRGYLTLPKSTQGKRPPPLIVNPHGGPIGPRDHWGYNGEVQLLAEAGFAVLQVNFRGSGGFGKAFMQAGYTAWGSAIQNDILDATDWVLSQGYADSERVCIYGASFGGYSALMAPIRDPDLFKCAIGFVGVYDLPMLYERGDVSERDSGVAFMKKIVGTDEEALKKYSPAHRADELNLPVFIIHGEQDPRAPVEHALVMMEAMDAAGKPYEKLLFEKEGHGLYDPETRASMYEAIVTFLSKHLKSEDT